MPRRLKKFPNGQSLIEVLLAMTIFTVGLSVIWVMYLNALNTGRANAERASGNQLALEGIEALRAIRDDNFSSLSNGTWGLTTTGGRWALSSASDTQGFYTRQVEISLLDADRAAVTTTVTWNFTPTDQASTTFATILTNWRKITPDAPWTDPVVVTSTRTIAGITSMFIKDNRLYITTAVTHDDSWLLIYDITNETNPVLLSQLSLDEELYAVRVTGDTAYLGAGGHNPSEIDIVDVASSTHPVAEGTIKITGSEDIHGLAISGNLLHVVRGPQGGQATYFIYDITDPPHPVRLGGLNLGGGGYDVVVKDGSPPFAFITSGNNLQEFQIVNTSNPANLAVGGSADMVGLEDAQVLAVTGTTALVGSASRNSAPEFYVYNIANPLAPSALSTMEIGADINAIALKVPVNGENNNLAFVGTSSSSHDFMTIDLTNLADPRVFSYLDLQGHVIDIVNTTNTVYVGTDNAATGLVILQAGN